MVDAARQMLDELMGRNRNLHPSEAPKVRYYTYNLLYYVCMHAWVCVKLC